MKELFSFVSQTVVYRIVLIGLASLAGSTGAFGQETDQEITLANFLSDRARLLALQTSQAPLVDREAIRSMQQLATELALKTPLPPLTVADELILPNAASPELEEFLVVRAENQNALALKQAAPGQNNSQQSEPAAIFLQSESALHLEDGALRAAVIAEEGLKELHVLPSSEPNFPSHFTAGQRAFLLERYKLSREFLTLQNSLRQSLPARRLAAIREWQERNAARNKTLLQAAQQVFPENP